MLVRIKTTHLPVCCEVLTEQTVSMKALFLDVRNRDLSRPELFELVDLLKCLLSVFVLFMIVVNGSTVETFI